MTWATESPDLTQVRECLTDIAADDKRAGEVIKSFKSTRKRCCALPHLAIFSDNPRTPVLIASIEEIRE